MKEPMSFFLTLVGIFLISVCDPTKSVNQLIAFIVGTGLVFIALVRYAVYAWFYD